MFIAFLYLRALVDWFAPTETANQRAMPMSNRRIVAHCLVVNPPCNFVLS
ncbi:hypothetical protein CRENPOLYSF1_200090 [Crenothrix polyspora]|uniref:Uncharacterized protein n=1 Tax=Crenothrix polyspora TaxID=360316 RepID=A0A1R4H6A1_9GAMM|nr:hypothetical protein CRENPOLYSF1_200090 [Crenothrix polyspora]